MAELNVKVNTDVESELKGCDGNTHSGVNSLQPREATLHGVVDSIGEAESVAVEFQVISSNHFASNEDPNDPDIWEEKFNDYGISAVPNNSPVEDEGEEFEATVEGISPCEEYYFKVKGEGS